MLIDGLRLRRVMGRAEWLAPVPFGDGWRMSHRNGDGHVIVTHHWADDPRHPLESWIHASMSRHDRVPSYEDMKRLHAAAFPGWAYSVWAPPDEHVNIHDFVLHIFGPVDGHRRLPDFTHGMRTL